MDQHAQPIAATDEIEIISKPRLRDWLWRPWYAKTWWIGIPLYWLAMGEPMRPAFLDPFADSGYVLVTHMIFLPITALVVLGAGWFIQFDDGVGQENIGPNLFEHRVGGPSLGIDMFDPRSGPLWIGNRAVDEEIQRMHGRR